MSLPQTAFFLIRTIRTWIQPLIQNSNRLYMLWTDSARRRYLSMVLCWLLVSLTSCSLPQVKAEERLFLPISLEFLGSYQLPKQDFQGTKVGGLSGLTYDRQRNQLYVISDDRSNLAPARFYTIQLTMAPTGSQPKIQAITLKAVTPLSDKTGHSYPAGSIDPEGIALSPRQSLFISSEGDSDAGLPPFIDEFDLTTGAWRRSLPIPNRYLPTPDKRRGVQNNRGFESLTLSSISTDAREPFRLFAAIESSLQQDLPVSVPTPAQTQPAIQPTISPKPSSLRFLHYLVGETETLLISEHLYPLEAPPEGSEILGLSDLLVLDQGGHFLSLERSFGLAGFGSKIFQLATGGATDISSIDSLAAGTEGILPIQKRLLLDLGDLGIPLDNFEGLSFGPQLPDGSQSLVLVSDDNFNELQVTEFLLFRLKAA